MLACCHTQACRRAWWPASCLGLLHSLGWRTRLYSGWASGRTSEPHLRNGTALLATLSTRYVPTARQARAGLRELGGGRASPGNVLRELEWSC